MVKFNYPQTKKVEQVDDYHGNLIPDPYRWLEDPNSQDTKFWVEHQNKVTQSYLEDIEHRDYIRKRLTELWDFPRAYAPLKVKGSYFQLRNNGLQNQNVLYKMDSLEGSKTVLLDPNKLSADGTVAVTHWEVSRDGNYLAYSTNEGGSDWQIWQVKEIQSGQDLSDRIEWSKFSTAAWDPDSQGFYYCAYEQPDEENTYEAVNQFQRVMYHRIGSPQETDRLIYQRQDKPDWGYDPMISEDGKFLILEVWKGTDVRNRLFYCSLENKGNFTELIPDLEAAYRFIGSEGNIFYIYTNYQSPLGKLIAIDLNQPEKENWQTIIAEDQDAIESVKLVNDQFCVIYLHDAYHEIKRFDKSGKYLGTIELPMIGSIFSFDREKYLFAEDGDDEFYFVFNSFTYPPTVMKYSFSNQETVEIDHPKIDFDPSKYQIKQKFSTSKDGTRIPMFLVRGKEVSPSPDTPTLLYGYGGFNISITPDFLVSRLVWLEMGGTLVVANLRGGGEYGEEWHKAGSLLQKQNVFDDMIACAEFLIDNNYTSSRKLAIEGRSNGGLLVGACMTQRPDLFAAALPAVGVLDMLRFDKFTIGWAWVSDYGSPGDPEQFEALYAYSPLHNIKQGVSYPATLVTTADHDDRVVPGHSYKFVAALQSANSGENPILIRIQTKAGHGFGKPTQIQIEEISDILSFLVKTLNITPIFYK